MNPPTYYPFSPVLSSRDPLGVYRDARVRTGLLTGGAKYDYPRLATNFADEVGRFVNSGGVVDPVNLVFWGDADRNTMELLVDRLPWTKTILSSGQWGVGEKAGVRLSLPDVDSIQPGQGLSWRPMAILTFLVSNFARLHARIFESFTPDDHWGHIALAGAHAEQIGRRQGKPYFWHRVEDWHEARNQLADDLRAVLGAAALNPRKFTTDGTWQGREFDGEVVFVRVS